MAVTELMQRVVQCSVHEKWRDFQVRCGPDFWNTGGGGIEVGSGLMIAPGVQVECKIGPLSNLKMNLKQKYSPAAPTVPYILVWN